MSEQNLKCRDCDRPMIRREDGTLVMTDHADDCAGIRRFCITAVPA